MIFEGFSMDSRQEAGSGGKGDLGASRVPSRQSIFPIPVSSDTVSMKKHVFGSREIN